MGEYDSYDRYWNGAIGYVRIVEVSHPPVKRWCRRCRCRLNSYNTTVYCSPCREHVQRGARIKEVLK